MLDLKPYGAFVENTVRPLLSEIKTLLDEHDLDSSKWTEIVRFAGLMHVITTFIKSFFETASIALAVYFLCKTWQS